MKKKKFLALLLTGAMALAALTGCSSGTETTEESTGGDASAESGDGTYKIALIQQHQTNAFQIGVTEGAQAKADELGVELNILSADQDAAKQISQIEQCVSEGYDAILFEPVDPDGLRDAAKAAADAGVIMINIVSACTDWESAGISAVSCGDNVKAGENEMQHVADLLGGKGNIAILTGPSSTTDTTARLEGYRNILANYPDMTEVVAPAAHGTPPRPSPPWRAGCPPMIWTPLSARTTAWPWARATPPAPTAASSSPAWTAPPTAMRPSRTAASPAPWHRTAA